MTSRLSQLVPFAALGLVGCNLLFSKTDCDDTLSCEDSPVGAEAGSSGDGDTGGSGGNGGNGGNGGGGASGGGDGDTGGSGGSVDPCDACSGDTPLCNDDNECVACLEASDCSAGAPLCDAGECTTCAENSDCSAHSGAVCNDESGACVECLTEAECSSGAKVCDRSTNICTELDAGAEFACEACEYNEQCAPGHVCVEMTYSNPMEGVVGSFCLWEKNAGLPGPNGTCGLSSQPYAQEATVTAVSGESATVCRPATTTCISILQHRTTVDGCETEFVDDAACGADGFNDGRCRLNGSMEPECSYPCIENEDCQAGSSCPMAGDKFCSL